MATAWLLMLVFLSATERGAAQKAPAHVKPILWIPGGVFVAAPNGGLSWWFAGFAGIMFHPLSNNGRGRSGLQASCWSIFRGDAPHLESIQEQTRKQLDLVSLHQLAEKEVFGSWWMTSWVCVSGPNRCPCKRVNPRSK